MESCYKKLRWARGGIDKKLLKYHYNEVIGDDESGLSKPQQKQNRWRLCHSPKLQ